MHYYYKLLLAALLSAGIAGTPQGVAQDTTNAPTGVPSSPSVPGSPRIGDFVSVQPNGQTPVIVLPETHTFQLIAKSGTTQYTTGATGAIPGNNDFTAYVARNGSGRKGYLSINHENTPGGVSLLDLDLNESTMLWEVGAVRKVDFSPLVRTVRNCSGGITPWGTVITSEENTSLGDANGDGYQDSGWQVEIDPVTGLIRDYNGDGKPDKLWAIGRMSHENIAVSADSVTIYQAEDGGSNCVYKFVASQKGNLSEGTLYVLRREALNPTAGTWVKVPNGTPAERNNTNILAASLGGTNWSGAEDIEFGPDGRMYFTSKGTGTIWRFKDNGPDVSGIEAWVTNRTYEVTYNGGKQMESWGTGIDNLTFDGDGNLWALQDGGRNNLWVISPDHTPQSPKLRLFMRTPFGSESTGLTFSPDYRYGFVSIQHPRNTNAATLTDAAGVPVKFDRDVTFVFARKEYLGKDNGANAPAAAAHWVEAFPNPFTTGTQLKVTMPEGADALLEVRTVLGELVTTLVNGPLAAGEHTFDFQPAGQAVQSVNGVYHVRLLVNGQLSKKTVIQLKQ
jgi:secreted PhoX family phosphatase